MKNIGKEKIHPSVLEQIKNGNHYMADCHFFPKKLGGGRYVEDMCNNHFQRTVNRMKRIHQVDDISPKKYNSIKDSLVDSMEEISSLEKDSMGDLHSFAKDIICNMFNIPQGTIEFHFVDENTIPSFGDDLLQSFKNQYQDEYDANDEYEQIERANKSIDRKRFQHALINGGANECMWAYKPLESYLEDIHYKLPNLYDKFNAFNDFNIWVTPDEFLSNEETPNGFNIYSNEDNDSYDVAINGTNLPMKLFSMGKAVLSILMKEKYNNPYIDYQTPWNMRIGYPTWKQFKKHARSRKDFPYMIDASAALCDEDYCGTMREMLAGTKKAQQMFENLY